ncbi:glutathione S-transferase C-terminal domain-containing protein [Streptomyces sp. NPDC005805]|uniref:glutathione S-transferase C-terminal domain-containing protein n=1 Tax=Streptomyces sp. NPDC005805 TaxID=3157068 RepID=UPI0033EFD855
MSATSPAITAPAFRGRIGCDIRSGHYAAPHRYRLHLSVSCPASLPIAVTHSLLGLGDTLPVHRLPAVPDAPGDGFTALRPLYEAGSHHHRGPAVAPALSDTWTGRVVSTHGGDIRRDLALRFAPAAGGPALYPAEADARAGAVARLCAEDIDGAAQSAGELGIADPAHEEPLGVLLDALGSLERALTEEWFVLGDALTAADVDVWTALVQLDTVHRRHLDAEAVRRIADHPALWSYARRLAADPAFGAHLDLDAIGLRHEARCRGHEAAGAAMQIVDWRAHTARSTRSTRAV